MSLKDFLIGAGTAIVGVALGAVIVCCCCNNYGGNGMGPRCDKQVPCYEQRDCPRSDDFRSCPKADKPCVMKMTKELGLSDEQMVQVKALQKAKREAAIADREKFETEFQKILNDEQKAKYNELLQARKGCCPKAESPEMDE